MEWKICASLPSPQKTPLLPRSNSGDVDGISLFVPSHPFRIECLIKFHERSFAAFPPSKLWGGGGGGAFVLAARFSLFNLRKETRGPPSLLQLPLFAFCDMIPPFLPPFPPAAAQVGAAKSRLLPFPPFRAGILALASLALATGPAKEERNNCMGDTTS